MSPKSGVRVVQGCTYATITILAQTLVTFLLPTLGYHVPPVVTFALISLLVGGGTVALHELGIVVPGAPSDFGLQQLLGGLMTLLQMQGWQPPPVPEPEPTPAPVPPAPVPAPPAPVQG